MATKSNYFGIYDTKVAASVAKIRARNAYPEAKKLTIVRRVGYSIKADLPRKGKRNS